MKRPPKELPVRLKLFVFLCAVSLLPMLLSSQVLIRWGGNSFRKLRELQVRDGLDQAVNSLHAAETRLLEGTRAVASWEDLHGFMGNPDPAWAANNLEGWAPQSYKLDYIAISNGNGDVLYEWNPTQYSKSSLLEPLLSAAEREKAGWVSTPQDLWLVAEADIGKGSKPLGTLVFGRRLSHRFLLDTKNNKDSDLMVYYGGRLLATTDTTSSLPYVDPTEIFSQLISRSSTYIYEGSNADPVIGFRELQDLHGTAIAALGWSSMQSPAGFMRDSINQVLLFFGVPLLALVLSAALILGLWIERPIRTLSNTMAEVSRTGDLSRRAPVVGGGEISSMSRSFNQMLSQLAMHQEELLTFQTMILAMKEGVLIENPDHRVVYMNPRMEELLGIDYAELTCDESSMRPAEMITSKGRRMEDERGFSTEEVEWIRPDGHRIQALKTSGRLEDHKGHSLGTLSTFVDITEKNDLEIELIETSRMAFLGLYSQGIIHNISGPLNSILGFSSLLSKEHPDSEIPQRINGDAQRMAEQISSLGCRWHRTGNHTEELLNINEIIQDEVKFLEADLFYKHNVEKQFDFDPHLPLIRGKYGDFSHAILNIIINAIDALLESPLHVLAVRTKHDNEEIRVEIQDSGVGIPPDNLNKIFLPFFSTKRRDLKDGIPCGAGLGLAIARKVLEPYDVQFEVESEVGRGTLMTLRIPYTQAKQQIERNQAEIEVLV